MKWCCAVGVFDRGVSIIFYKRFDSLETVIAGKKRPKPDTLIKLAMYSNIYPNFFYVFPDLSRSNNCSPCTGDQKLSPVTMWRHTWFRQEMQLENNIVISHGLGLAHRPHVRPVTTVTENAWKTRCRAEIFKKSWNKRTIVLSLMGKFRSVQWTF